MNASTASLNLSTGGGAGGSQSGGSTGGGAGAESTGSGQDSNAVMNEKVRGTTRSNSKKVEIRLGCCVLQVQALAGSIYEEFEGMMAKYDAEVVKNLMPLIVNILENLDLAYTENQEMEVEVELLKEDNEQLVTQYEREKQLRKGSEARLIEVEDSFEGDRKDTTVKIESLTSIVKMFELKAKNSQDQSKPTLRNGSEILT